MKRFFKTVAIEARDGGWQVTLDGRPIRTQRGSQQIVPSEALATLLAAEWQAQGETIDRKSLVLRDLADLAIDVIAPDRAATIARLLQYAETDTLCYRADPGDALFARQEQLWEPIVIACEARHKVRFERISGVTYRAQGDLCITGLRARLEAEDAFTLAALLTLGSLSASVIIALAMLDEGADAPALFAAANCEEDWQAELWGTDAEAETVRALRLEAFGKAAEFLRALR